MQNLDGRYLVSFLLLIHAEPGRPLSCVISPQVQNANILNIFNRIHRIHSNFDECASLPARDFDVNSNNLVIPTTVAAIAIVGVAVVAIVAGVHVAIGPVVVTVIAAAIVGTVVVSSHIVVPVAIVVTGLVVVRAVVAVSVVLAVVSAVGVVSIVGAEIAPVHVAKITFLVVAVGVIVAASTSVRGSTVVV